MALVEHHEPEPRAQPIHVEIGRVVGAHGELLDAMLASADHSDVDRERAPQRVVPLAHEIEGGRDDEGAALAQIDRHQRDLGLAGAGREHHHAAAARAIPGLERFELIWARLGEHAGAALELGVVARFVDVLGLLCVERANDFRVSHRGRAIAARPRIPHAPGQRHLTDGDSVDDEGPGVELQAQHGAEPTTRSFCEHGRSIGLASDRLPVAAIRTPSRGRERAAGRGFRRRAGAVRSSPSTRPRRSRARRRCARSRPRDRSRRRCRSR
jgi:hypothetical protein